MTVRVLQGHALDVLAGMPAKSVHVAVTSPPYWGLRAYQTPPQVWGDSSECAHEWGPAIVDHKRGADAGPSAQAGNTVARVCPPTTQQGAFCTRCGAWRGELGSEPTLDLFVAHLVEVFAAVGRVLRDDGTLWINLGDSYCADRAGNTKPRAEHGAGWGPMHPYTERQGQERRQPSDKTAAAMAEANGLKAGDLCMAPARFALAMQVAGWTLRSQIVLPKRAPMPESVSGTTWTRHQIRRAEYERLQSLRAGVTAGSVPPPQSADVPGVRDGEGSGVPADGGVPRSEAAVRGEREGQGDDAASGGTAGRARTAVGVRPFSSGEGASASLRGDGTGESRSEAVIGRLREDRAGEAVSAAQAPTVSTDRGVPGHAAAVLPNVQTDRAGEGASSEPQSAAAGSRNGGDADLGGVVADTPGAQAALLLLQGTGAVDDGSRRPAEQGRAPRQGERGSGVRELQQQEAHEDVASLLSDKDWVDCPGCPKCDHPDPEQRGYVQRWGSWRPTSAYEVLYLFSKAGQRYYADGEAVRLPVSAATLADGRTARGQRGTKGEYGTVDGNAGYNPAGRNLWNYVMWAPEPSSLQHYAAFPRFIPRLAIQAGTSEAGVCSTCGAPWLRVVEKTRPDLAEFAHRQTSKNDPGMKRRDGAAAAGLMSGQEWNERSGTATLGWRQSCRCPPHSPVPATCLDPFSGSGTTLIEANALGRHGIGIELQSKYVDISHKRLSGQPLSLFAHEAPPAIDAEAAG